MLKNWSALALAASMFVSSTAFAATNANQGVLTPGKPASVKQAQGFLGPHALLLLLGSGVVIGGVVLAASGGSHGTTSTTTTGAPQ